ncbi:MAG: lysophospholipid acyltransferase family protein [Candidatus Omnitrophota bacterium]
MIYWFLKFIFGPLVRLIWIKRIYGTENIPKSGGFIIVANHASYFDFFCLPAVCKRRIYFFAAEKFFKHPIWSALMKSTKQIRVNRCAEDKSEAYQAALKVLSENKVLGIFPEGTRSADGKLQPAYSGAVKIALIAGVPILPIGITGAYDILSRHRYLPRFKKSQVKIGKCISLTQYYGQEDNHNLLQQITDKTVMAAIHKLIINE